jgi:hypothetical protein
VVQQAVQVDRRQPKHRHARGGQGRQPHAGRDAVLVARLE